MQSLTPQTKPHPLDLLLPYQRSFCLDNSRFKIANWSRQTGKSTSTAEEAARDCVTNPVAQDWVCLSAGQRQAEEWLLKARAWAECYDIWSKKTKWKNRTAYTYNASEIIFANGSRIIAIPASERTSRGYNANLVLDEFAWHERPDDIFKAIYPSISNPLKGLKKLRIISTPNGRGNMFYRLFTDGDNGYVKSKVTIYDAIAQGLAINADELRRGIPDADTWEQEFLCEFVDSTTVLLTYELIGNAEKAMPEIPANTQLYIGVDVGRKHDRTCIITLADLDGLLIVVDVEILSNTLFDKQLDIISQKINDNVQSMAIDATGIGAGLAESLQTKFGGRVEPITYNNSIKNEHCQTLKRVFESQKIIIPSDKRYREDLHGIVKKVSVGGTITYTAERNADGHSDFASALMLAVSSAQSANSSSFFMPISFKR